MPTPSASRTPTLVAEVAKVSVDLVRQMPVSLFREAAQYVNGFSKGAAKQDKPTLDAELVIDVSPRIEQAGRILSQLELREPDHGRGGGGAAQAGRDGERRNPAREPDPPGQPGVGDAALHHQCAADQQARSGEPLPAGFYLGWPKGWRNLIAPVTEFYGFPAAGVGSAWQMTGARLVWWHSQAVRIAEARRPKQRRGKGA